MTFEDLVEIRHYKYVMLSRLPKAVVTKHEGGHYHRAILREPQYDTIIS